MKQLKFKDKIYHVPQSWEDITLEDQIRVSDAEKEFKNDYTKKIAIIAGYANIPVEVLKKARPDEVAPLFKQLEFLSKEIPSKQINEFTYKGEMYYVGQNLLQQEFQDFISFETAMSNAGDNHYKALPILMAIMCKRKKQDGQLESLDDYDIDQRAELFKTIPITIANGLSVFFYAYGKMLSTRSLLYSKGGEVIQMKVDEVGSSLKKLGGGVLRYLLRKVLQTYTWYLVRSVKQRLGIMRSKSFIQTWKKTFTKWLRKKRKENKKTF